MKRLFALPFIVALAGCNSAEPYLEVARQQQANWDEMTKVLESVTDEKSMEAARERFEELTVRGQTLSRRVKAMPKPSPEILEQLHDHSRSLQRSVNRVQEELARVRQLPGGPEFLKDVETIARGSR